MILTTFTDGYVINGTFPDQEILSFIFENVGLLALTIADPPYGNIVDRTWDKTTKTDIEFCAWMIDWTNKIAGLSHERAALYTWGGVGRAREGKTPPFRPFLRYLVEVELQTPWNLATPITWKKRRAYGIQWSYLFCREECAYLVLGDVKKPRRFEVPLLKEKRGYAGYDPDYPAKSDYLRRSNVWADITELMRDLAHINQKPRALMEIPILAHTAEGEFVLDPFAGSGTTAFAARHLNRKFVVVEQDPIEYAKIVEALKSDSKRWA